MFQIINVAHAGVISDATPISQVAINVLNFLLSMVGIIAIIALVLAGAMYLTSAGDDKRMQSAKIYAQYAIVGIIMTMGAYVALMVIGQFFKQ